jgi:hypothetical protein
MNFHPARRFSKQWAGSSNRESGHYLGDRCGFNSRPVLINQPMNLNLKDLQALLYELIVSPKGTITNLSAATAHQPGWLETMVRGDERLSALRRLEIYVDAYFYRLLDC